MRTHPAHSISKNKLSIKPIARPVRFLTLMAGMAVILTIMLVKSITDWKQHTVNPEFVCGGKDSILGSGEFMDGERLAWFMNEKISPLAQALPNPEPESAVLGVSSEEKWIDVDLDTQTLRAMEGDKEVMKFLISSGKWAPTPTGEYRIWIKLRYTKMSGGDKDKHTYYYLPNVPFVMYFYQGFGLHGAYWHNNFGQPMSHGCVNMAIPDAEKIFYWVGPVLPEGSNMIKSSEENPGTRIVIHGIAPKT